MSALLERVEQTIADRSLFRRGERVLVAVSGGVDSMVLLHVLHRLAARTRWRLVVAHFNHQLRGRASDADERLVVRAARRFGLTCVVGRGDVRHFGAQEGLSLEMAARLLRHEFLARTARAKRCRTIALAHHADDQVELFLLRFLRGAGAEGLAGMKWRSPSPADERQTLARPLLETPKAALQEFARSENVAFREDATNSCLDVLRNRVRHELVPLLTRQYQPALQKVILRQIAILAEDAALLGELAQDWLRREPTETFGGLAVALQRRVLHEQLPRLGVASDFDLIERLRAKADTPVSVGRDVGLTRDAAGRLHVAELGHIGFNPAARIVELGGRAGGDAFDGVAFGWRSRRATSPDLPKAEPGRETFDADAVGGTVVLRHWRPGDRFQPIGMKQAVKLQDLFTNLKIPRGQRHELVVATTAQGKIWWVEGVRVGERFKVRPGTRRRLCWEWRRAADRSAES